MANPEPGAIPKDPDQNGYIGNEACARCHSAIYQSYRRTAMAQASGPAIDALTPAEFTHKESGVHYRIYSEKGSAWLSFDRPGDPAVQGKRELLYLLARAVVGEATCLIRMDFSSNLPSTGMRTSACGTWLRHIRLQKKCL